VLYSDLHPPTNIAAAPLIPNPYPLTLLSPAQGSAYRLVSGFDAGTQRIRLEAVGGQGLREVILFMDGEEVARFSQAPYQFWWTLAAGEHRAWAEGMRDDGGRVVSEVVVFTVE
jgi:hypothetical protein